MEARIEHVNMTVSDPDRSAALIERLFGWRVRWAGDAANGGRTVHVGTDGQYLSLYGRPDRDGAPLAWSKGRPLNHVAFVVDDIDAAERRVVEAGLTPFGHGDYEPGRRFYVFDPDGIEFEIVSYAPAPEAAS
ncbi:MAG TPA: VOC family protein [Allosphingosinicella sp.]|jgi:catechol 2,3-dioxygenase-like lactoylglutathione lyase family enzyme